MTQANRVTFPSLTIFSSAKLLQLVTFGGSLYQLMQPLSTHVAIQHPQHPFSKELHSLTAHCVKNYVL